MSEFLQKLFSSDFMPHGHCYFWDPSVLWLNVISDGLIALSYYAIPFVLFSFARRRKDLTFDWIFLAFGLFILACGSTHLMAVWTVWYPTYRLDGVIKAITAGASVATAVLLVPLRPKLLALPSPTQLREANTVLAREIAERRAAEERVQQMNAELERRVKERTLELSQANLELRAEIQRRESVEAQLIQSQKMEAVGRLAGGVAHDFNNLLTVILGFTDTVLADPGTPPATREPLEEVRNAGIRAASLTRQLLAFSRRQIMQPKVLDLNQIVSEMERMLKRLMGDDISLQTSLSPALGCVRADPSQIEQVIMNLAVNARDAMPAGGRLTIETSNAELDENYCREHLGAEPGPYIMLAISDTGVGMDEATKARIFEPFFTTKELGKGTGLGLSTVFGIVKQSGGNIGVYSEPGSGTTFRIYLPRIEAPREETQVRDRGVAGGTETLLVCEDDEKVRALIRTVLTTYGYTILEAGSASEALLLRSRYSGPLHLLLTDIAMPEVSGRELAEEMRTQLPGLKVLFMSGHTESVVVGTRPSEPNFEFLPKPFTPLALARKVREVLDA